MFKNYKEMRIEEMSKQESSSKSQLDIIETKIKARRKMLGVAAVVGLSPIWSKPVVNSVLLPAHAQTSMCMTDATVGWPLAGNASGALTCQAACEVEAADQSAQLCEVREIPTATGTDCACDLDLP